MNFWEILAAVGRKGERPGSPHRRVRSIRSKRVKFGQHLQRLYAARTQLSGERHAILLFYFIYSPFSLLVGVSTERANVEGSKFRGRRIWFPTQWGMTIVELLDQGADVWL